MKTKKNDRKNPETEPAKTQGKSISGQQGTVAAGAPADKASLKKAEQTVEFEWSPGDVILDLYEVQKVTEGFGEDSEEKNYHEGGFGRVYKVWHRSWRRDMAVKTPRAEVFTTADQKEAFTRECETWINLGLHPHIAACHYVRELGGVPRVFSEYAEGGTLEDWIRHGRLYDGDKKKVLARILDVSIQFARGLHYAHERGVIHQDVKPLNALMWNDQTLKVTDFGLAGARHKAAVAGPGNYPGDGDGQSIMVSVGGMTPSHCSPEQAAGEKLTRRTDIWSWAVSILQMFNGEVTWQSGSLAAMALESYLEGDGENEEIPSMPSGVADLLRRCFREDPDDRPHELKECATELCKIYQAELGDPYPRPAPRAAGDTADALNNRALSLLDLGKPGEAQTFFNRALELDKHHVAATYNLGIMLWREHRYTNENILASIEEIKKDRPNDARLQCALGWVQMESHCFPQAQIYFERAVQLGEDPDALRGLELAQHLAEAKAGECLHTFEGHTKSVESVSFSPDNRLILSGSMDKTLKLWDVATGKCLRTFEGHTSWVNSVAFSQDGRFSLSGSDDKTIKLWNVFTGRCMHTISTGTKINAIALSPDGCFILSDSDFTLKLWEVSTGKCLRTFEGHKSWVNSVAFSPDGRFAISGSGDTTIKLWEVATGKCLRTFKGPDESIEPVAFSPDGRFILSGGKMLILWETATRKCLLNFEGHFGWVFSVAFSPDGHFAISGNDNRTLQLWEVTSGRCLHTFEGHTGNKGKVMSVAISTDGCYAISGSMDSTIKLWEILSVILYNRQEIPLLYSTVITIEEAIKRENLHKSYVSYARQAYKAGKILEALDHVKQARAIQGFEKNQESLELKAQISTCCCVKAYIGGWLKNNIQENKYKIRSAIFSPDGLYALSGSFDTLNVWDVSTGNCMHTFDWHKNGINSVILSPDGRFAMLDSRDKTINLWDIATGKWISTFKGYAGSARSAISPDGRYILIQSSDMTLKLFKIDGGNCLRTFEGHTHWVNSTDFSNDGRYALSGSRDRTLRLWDVATGSCLGIFNNQTWLEGSVTFSGDGRFALSGSDMIINLWEIPSGKRLRTFSGHTGMVTSIALSPNDRFIISGSKDKTLRLWDVSTSKCLRTFKDHTDVVNAVAFSPDGRYILSGSSDKTLKLWELDWEYEFPGWADWDDGAEPYLHNFLNLRNGKWGEDDFKVLINDLSRRGCGWLRPEGVHHKLEQMTPQYITRSWFSKIFTRKKS